MILNLIKKMKPEDLYQIKIKANEIITNPNGY